MLKARFKGQTVIIDEKATRAWYDQASAWACDCGHCRNFLALARKHELPDAVREALAPLGVPLDKATYVCELYPEGNGFRYQFSYRIAGYMLAPCDHNSDNEGEMRYCHEPYPYGAPGFPEPHFDLEFCITLPWVLEESPN